MKRVTYLALKFNRLYAKIVKAFVKDKNKLIKIIEVSKKFERSKFLEFSTTVTKL